MAYPSILLQRLSGYFHSLSKVITNDSQYPFESKYKSSHTITSKEVLIDSIPFCATEVEVDEFITSNAGILQKYSLTSLTEVSGSNGQAWYINDSKFVRPFISPVDVPDETTNMPSIGLELKLYKEDGTFISPTTGVWFVDYYAGIIHFENGYTPSEMGWGIPKVTVYSYIGKSLNDRLEELEQTTEANNTELITTDKVLIQNDKVILNYQIKGDVVNNIAMVFPTIDSPFCIEYTCEVNILENSVIFNADDNLNGQYCIVTYMGVR